MRKNKQVVYDLYGFRTDPVTLVVESYLQDPELDNQKTQLWKKLLLDLDKCTSKQQQKQIRQKVREEVRRGIPDKLRSQVWMRLIAPPLKQYESIIVKQQLKQIDRDINRTIPCNKRGEQLKIKLKHMLNIIAVAFPNMGYCQGLNFITANMLLILSQKQAYNVLYYILYWQGHQKLLTNVQRINTKFYILNKLVRKHYPQLFRHLEKHDIGPELYATSWFITLFHNRLPCSYVFRIMEIYFLEGEKILYRVGLQILKQKKRVLKKLDSPQQIMSELKSSEQFTKALIDKFFKDMLEINLSRKQIQSYEIQHQQLAHKE